MTVLRRRISVRRLLLGSASFIFTAASLVFATTPDEEVAASTSLADSLGPSSWAMTVPAAWLAAPVPEVRRHDQLDILAVRTGDRSYAAPVAYAVTVMSAGEHGLVIELDEADAVAIGAARGAGWLLVPLLRSTR